MPKNKSINLLPQEEFDSSVMGRILIWAMGTFRIIVIVTEMVVMGAFLSRFWLDAQNSDLNDSIKTKTAQIKIQSEFEKEFKGIQKKLDIFKQITTSHKSSSTIDLVASKTPDDVTLSSIAIQDSTAQVKGTAGSEIGISQFISNLKTVQEFKNVELGQVTSSENNPLSTIFNIKIDF